MVGVRACVHFSVIFLCFHVAIGKPMFGLLYCDLFCEDDDTSTTTTSTSTEDYWDEVWCSVCDPRRPRTTTPTPPVVNPMGVGSQPGFNFMIPSNGMNFTMSPGNGGYWVNFWPWGGQNGGPPGAPPVATPAPAATTPGEATTAAGAAATTAGPTTAAPAGK